MEFLGIDVSKKTLDACLLKDGIQGRKKHKVFPNDRHIIRSLTDWLLKQKSLPDNLTVMMDSTGIYHENLVFGLHDCATFIVCLANLQSVQAAAYLNVVSVECVSGSSVRGRSRMSKTGPSHVRASCLWRRWAL